jgi:prophage DNA circulation protein
MSYLTEKQPASFRGVKFFVKSHKTAVGRKTAIYDLPFNDNGAATLDLGRRPRKYKISAVLIETPDSSLREQREALVAALETRDPGLLIHPVYGRKQVVAQGEIDLIESTDNGGVLEVEFEFIEAREKPGAAPKPSPKADMISKARKLRTDAGTTMSGGFLTNVPDLVAASNLRTLDEVLTDLTRINQLVGAALAVPTHFAHQITAITNQAAELLNTPQALYNTLDSLFAELLQAVRTITDASVTSAGGLVTLDSITVALAALGSDAPTPVGETQTRIDERTNHALLLQTLRASALGSLAETVAETTFSAANDARNVLQTLTDALASVSDEPIADIEPEQQLVESLRDVAASSVVRLGSVAGTLAELTTYTPPTTLPAIVVAYNLYADATREDEILERNPHVVHPLFAPGRTDLEILAP